jgi:DNA-binding transcriptional regulator YiaG
MDGGEEEVMAKAPVARKQAMFREVDPKTEVAKSADSVEVQPELCHGSETIPRQIEDEKSNPRKIGDPQVDSIPLAALSADSISVEDFRAYLKEVGLTQRDFAKFARTPYDTVRGWARGSARIPGMAATVLVMLRRDKTLASTCRATGWDPLW